MIPLPVSSAVSRFSEKITGYDEGGSYVNGRWVESSGDDYVFRGVLSHSDGNDKQILTEAEIAQGAITIHTKKTLYHPRS